MNKLFIFGITALLVVTTTACSFNDDEYDDDDVACTTEVVPSVVIAIIDAPGFPLPGATVTYSVDDENELEAECIDPMDALSGECTRFVAGWEVTGDFIIVAEKESFQPAEASVIVELDEVGCHVVTQEIELTLVPES